MFLIDDDEEEMIVTFSNNQILIFFQRDYVMAYLVLCGNSFANHGVFTKDRSLTIQIDDIYASHMGIVDGQKMKVRFEKSTIIVDKIP